MFVSSRFSQSPVASRQSSVIFSTCSLLFCVSSLFASSSCRCMSVLLLDVYSCCSQEARVGHQHEKSFYINPITLVESISELQEPKRVRLDFTSGESNRNEHDAFFYCVCRKECDERRQCDDFLAILFSSLTEGIEYLQFLSRRKIISGRRLSDQNLRSRQEMGDCKVAGLL